MREIKFRAWNRLDKQMYWFDLMWGNYRQGDGWIGMLPVGETDKSKRRQIDPYDCEIIQYTGLHDRNSTEIYEGDVLLFPKGIWGGDEDHRFVVEWDKSRAAFVGDGTPYDWQNYCAVIGNVWENPQSTERQP